MSTRPISAHLPKPVQATTDFELDEAPPLIPEGDYLLRFDHHETRLMFGRCAKVILWFTVVSGSQFGTRLARYFNALRLTEPIGRGGKFTARRRSDFAREVLPLLSGASLAALAGMTLKGAVRTVTQSSQETALAPAARYSVVSKLKGPHK